MKSIKLVLLSMFALLALGAVTSTAASASGCAAEGEKTYGICAAGAEVGTETLNFTSGASKLKSKVLNKAVTIECKKDKGSVEVTGDPGKFSNGKIEFTECKLTGITGCGVKEPIVAKFGGKPTEAPARIEANFEQEGETPFTEILLTGGVCEGIKLNVTGSQKCEADKTNAEAETEKASHSIICKPTGSNLKLGSEKAEFTSTETTTLSKGGNFSFFES